MSLTHKQAAFCMALAHGSDPAEAWRAVYKAGSLGPRTVEKRARALLDKPAVAAHLAALHADRAAGGAADRAVPLADGAAPDATRAPVAGQPADSLPPKGTASAASTPGTGTPGTRTPGTRPPGPDTSGGSGSLSPSTPGTAPHPAVTAGRPAATPCTPNASGGHPKASAAQPPVRLGRAAPEGGPSGLPSGLPEGVSAGGPLFTLDAHIAKLEELRDLALEAEKYGSAIQAEISRGKAAGFYTERLRTELSGPDGGALQEELVITFVRARHD